MGTTSTSGWAVFIFIVGFMLAGTLFLGNLLAGLAGVAMMVASIPVFAKAKSIEA